MVFDATAQPVDTTVPLHRFKIKEGETTTFAYPFGGLSASTGIHLVMSSNQDNLVATAETATFAGFYR